MKDDKSYESNNSIKENKNKIPIKFNKDKRKDMDRDKLEKNDEEEKNSVDENYDRNFRANYKGERYGNNDYKSKKTDYKNMNEKISYNDDYNDRKIKGYDYRNDKDYNYKNNNQSYNLNNYRDRETKYRNNFRNKDDYYYDKKDSYDKSYSKFNNYEENRDANYNYKNEKIRKEKRYDKFDKMFDNDDRIDSRSRSRSRSFSKPKLNIPKNETNELKQTNIDLEKKKEKSKKRESIFSDVPIVDDKNNPKSNKDLVPNKFDSKLYISNLPTFMEPNEIVFHLNKMIKESPLMTHNKEDPEPFILACWLNKGMGYGFIDIRSANDTTMMLNNLNGVKFLGNCIRLSRPDYYKNVENNKTEIIYDSSNIKEDKDVLILLKNGFVQFPTKVILLENILRDIKVSIIFSF